MLWNYLYLLSLNFSEFYVYCTPDQGVMKQFKALFIMQREQLQPAFFPNELLESLLSTIYTDFTLTEIVKDFLGS